MPIPFFFCQRGRSPFVEKQAPPCLVPFFDLEHVTFFVSHYSGFLVFVSSFQEVDELMLDTTNFEGVPD